MKASGIGRLPELPALAYAPPARRFAVLESFLPYFAEMKGERAQIPSQHGQL
jgi:hypothetical protein